MDKSELPLQSFLFFIKNTAKLQNPASITIDNVNQAKLKAVRAVYPFAKMQWCLFHFARFWRQKMKELIKVGGIDDNKAVRKEMMR
jgi:hypothetical protein